LPEFDVIQPDVVQGLKHRGNGRIVRKVLQGLLHVHLQHVRNALALEVNLESFA